MEYECTLNKRTWQADLCMMYQNPHSIAFRVDTRGSRFDTCIGKTGEFRWVVFPLLDKGTELSRFDDIHWNYESLYRILKNREDAYAIALAISIFDGEIEE